MKCTKPYQSKYTESKKDAQGIIPRHLLITYVLPFSAALPFLIRQDGNLRKFQPGVPEPPQ